MDAATHREVEWTYKGNQCRARLHADISELFRQGKNGLPNAVEIVQPDVLGTWQNNHGPNSKFHNTPSGAGTAIMETYTPGGGGRLDGNRKTGHTCNGWKEWHTVSSMSLKQAVEAVAAVAATTAPIAAAPAAAANDATAPAFVDTVTPAAADPAATASAIDAALSQDSEDIPLSTYALRLTLAPRDAAPAAAATNDAAPSTAPTAADPAAAADDAAANAAADPTTAFAATNRKRASSHADVPRSKEPRNTPTNAELRALLEGVREELCEGPGKDAINSVLNGSQRDGSGPQKVQIYVDEEEFPDRAVEKDFFKIGYATAGSNWATGRAAGLTTGNPRGVRTIFARIMHGIPRELEAIVHAQFREYGGPYSTAETFRQLQVRCCTEPYTQPTLSLTHDLIFVVMRCRRSRLALRSGFGRNSLLSVRRCGTSLRNCRR